MKIKTKLRLGLTFLFVIFLFLGGIAVWFIHQLSEASAQILKDNYKTLQYMQVMMREIGDDQNPLPPQNAALFERALRQQEQNVTEPGESKSTGEIRLAFNRIEAAKLRGTQFLADKRSIRSAIFNIIELNNRAIVRKNNIARKTAHDATLFVALLATGCFLIGFTFIINFPGYVADPISDLLAGIKDVADKKYDSRIQIESLDEFGELAKAFNQMAFKLNEYENSSLAKISFEKMRIETIVDNLSDAVIGFDEEDRLLFANPTALKILSLTKNQLIGRKASEIAVENQLFKNLMSADEAEPMIKIADGEKTNYFSREIYKITVPSSQPNNAEKAVIKTAKDIGFVVLLKNITRFQELNEARTNFVATISHELKTPIAAIKLSSKLLEDTRIGELNEEQRYLVKNINDDGERLLRITGELLDLTQVETGNIQLQFQLTEPAAIIEYAYNTVQLLASQKAVKIEISLEEKLPQVNADLEKTAWVLVNFLSNAIRYSGENSQIELRAKRSGQMVEFSVRDFGKGIEEKYLELIFDRYFRVPADMKERSGTGLGLAISKEFIKAQDGKIWAESTKGSGSKFSFALFYS